MGVEILSEEQYKFLQTLGKFDLKTSSWLLTPHPIRILGGAIFGDCRYQHVFTYHNGAESYYAARDSEVSLLFEPNNLYALDTIAMQIVVFRIMY